MTEKQIKKLAEGFRIGMISNSSSRSMCFAISAPLQGYLSACGVQCELVKGELATMQGICEHYWLKLPSGKILDPTADQFNGIAGSKDMPKVYLGEQPVNYLINNQQP